jgi:hypothetical protein
LAAKWYEEADRLGNASGKPNLAFLYIRGLGVSQDYARGIAMLEELAAEENIAAIWSLYHLYASGLYLPADADKANGWLERAAEMGSGTAACEFARKIEQSAGGAPSVDRVLDWLTAAAEKGEIDAQETLGRWLYDGKFVPRDGAGALRWLSIAAERGNPNAQAWMGDVLYQGIGVMVDRVSARAWYERAAERGHLGALMAMNGFIFEGNGTDEERSSLFSLWLKLAESGHPLAQRQVANFYIGGVGTARSIPDAIRWLRSDALGDDTDVKMLLANLLLEGEAGEDAAREAVELFAEAARMGNTGGEYNLGVCFRRGIGVVADRNMARQLYESAASKGYLSAQLALGDLLVELGDDASLRAAAGWYERAAAAGVPGAAFGLAGLYEAGMGVEVDREKAIALNTLAAEAGYAEARLALDRLGSAASPAR